jgi:hypothetical protein
VRAPAGLYLITRLWTSLGYGAGGGSFPSRRETLMAPPPVTLSYTHSRPQYVGRRGLEIRTIGHNCHHQAREARRSAKSSPSHQPSASLAFCAP